MMRTKLTAAAGLSLALVFGGGALHHNEASAASATQNSQNKVKCYTKHSTHHYRVIHKVTHKPQQGGQVQKPSGNTNTGNQNQGTVQKPSGNTNTGNSQNQGTAQKPSDNTNNGTSSLSAYEQEVVTLTNKERTSRGLKALQVDSLLSKVAREKSNDMQKHNYFSHTSPTYGSPFDMMKKYGVTYKSAGENIAKGQKTPQEVVKAWMNSEGHRANILNASFTHIGVGYAANGNIWTQQFIGK